MRTILLFLALLSGAMAFGQKAQIDEQKNGLVKITYFLKEGTIVLYMAPPERGATLSGVIETVAAGKSTREKAKNANQLLTYELSLTAENVQVGPDTYACQVPADATTITWTLANDKGKPVAATAILTAPPTLVPTRTTIPSYMVGAMPALIRGPFDGDLHNHQVYIKDRPARVLAESGNRVYVETPVDVEGKQPIRSVENGVSTQGETNVLQLILGVDQASLQRGEQTMLHIRVEGLQDLNAPVPLSVVNASPANIDLQNGNTQAITIQPGAHNPSGIYNESLNITARQRGGFAINVDVLPPSEAGMVDDALLCTCYIDGVSHLLSPAYCLALGGTCSPPETELPEDESPVEPPVTRQGPAFELPADIMLQPQGAIIRIPNPPANAVAIRITQQGPDEDGWTTISQEQGREPFSTIWYPPLGQDGTYAIRTQVVTRQDELLETIQFTQVHASLSGVSDIVFSISERDIERDINRARALGDRIREAREEQDDLRRRQSEAEDESDTNSESASELETIDKTLDQIPRVFRDSLEELVDSLEALRGQLPPEVNKDALAQAVKDAEARLKACQDRLRQLQQEKENLEAERDRLKAEQDEQLEEIDQLFRENGWTGGYGYHSDGRYWFGYVGDENTNTDIFSEAYAIKKQLKQRQKRYLEALKRLGDLPGEIEAAENECGELAEALRQAKETAARGDQFQAAMAETEELCRQIRSLMAVLWRWCVDNPDRCSFREQLRKFFEKCPTSSSELERFFEEYEAAISRKKEQESAFESEAERQDRIAQGLEDDMERIDDKIADLEAEQRRAYAEAERKRRQRARELEDARQREAQRRAEEARRANPEPQPILNEPIDPSDDQLRFQAQLLFKELYLEYLVDKGPCDCVTKALALANNTNTIVSDIIGRIGVGVAFAPLEAFPGVSLGGRLAIGALKSIASALFGGEKISEELAKNLFSVIGGEIFPKLAGNKFVGNRMKGLADKGLEAILEAEGVRAISWEGKTRLRECGEVSGSTTILVNPNTGWATILIRIDGCPLVVIKYRFNEDGVPQGKPIVKTVR